MAELLGEDEQLVVGDFQLLRRRPGWSCDLRHDCWSRGAILRALRRWYGRAAHQLDADRHVMELLDLANRNRAVRTIQHAFNETTLRIARPIRKLWHAK